MRIGFKSYAKYIEDDNDCDLEASAEYIILEGRGGGNCYVSLRVRAHIDLHNPLRRQRHMHIRKNTHTHTHTYIHTHTQIHPHPPTPPHRHLLLNP